MPLYEYECEACGERFELIRKFSDAARGRLHLVREGSGDPPVLVTGDSVQGDRLSTSRTTRKRRKGARAKGAREREQGRRGQGRRQTAAKSDTAKSDGCGDGYRNEESTPKSDASAKTESSAAATPAEDQRAAKD